VICCTICEKPIAGSADKALSFVVDVLLNPNPMPEEDFLAKISELRSLNAHLHQLALEP